VWKVTYGFKSDRSEEFEVFINKNIEDEDLKSFVSQRISITNRYVRAYSNSETFIKKDPPLYSECKPIDILNVDDYKQGIDPDQVSMIF